MDYDLASIYNDKELENLKNSFKYPKNICVFINRLRCDHFTLQKEFKDLNLSFEKVNEYCYLFEAKYRSILSSMKAFTKFQFYIQNYASYLCALNLDVRIGENILDMCAAPGGKSINLANFTQNKAHLVCNEVNKKRFFILQKNLKNYGIRAKLFMKNGTSIGRLCPLTFDKILLDAPCSSLAKMGLQLKKNSKQLKDMAKLQKKLLHSALKALRVGGELVYSTCTFTKEENEEVVENALRSDFNIELLDVKLEYALAKDGQSKEFKAISRCKRILPCEHYDGFFIARLRKKA